MAVRPVDVRRKEFSSGFRGYDANQVDDFLDEVADEFERTYAENRRLSEELTTLKGRLEQFEELEAAIREAAVHAQQVAQDLRRNANREAELIVREAKEQAHRILADSSGQVERVQESYEALRKAKQDFNNDFRHLLQTYADVIERADVTSAKAIEASLRERLDTESVATARQAAETQRNEDARAVEAGGGTESAESTTQGTSPNLELEKGGDSDEATQRFERVSSEMPDALAGDADGTERGRGQETEAPENESVEATERGSAETSGFRERGRREAPFAPAEETGESVGTDSGASDEVDQEEDMPSGGGRASDGSVEGENDKPEADEEESGGHRASRFFRRRD